MTTPRTRLLATVATAAVFAAALVATATPAQAKTPTADKATAGPVLTYDPATDSSRRVSPDEAESFISSYWTPQRLKTATPAPRQNTTKGERSPQGNATTLAKPHEAPGNDVKINTDAWFSYTNGKIYYTESNGTNRYCSGGAVNSGKKRLVITAGHCVFTRPGGWVRNWVFIPGYNWGNEPRGRFTAYQPWTSTGWTQDGDRNRDFAFVITNRNASGQRVVDAAGGHGLTINPGRPYVHVFGHPSNRTNGSQVQWYCWGTTWRWSLFDSGQGLRCNFGPGASGGPWLRDYSSNGLGYAISNTHGIDSDGDNYGPYYDGHTGDVYRAAENASP